MSDMPTFPEFRELKLEDRDILHPRLLDFQSRTSELTFVNLYIWRSYYGFRWSIYEDRLLILAKPREGGESFMLPPVGPASRRDVTHGALTWMRDEHGVEKPRIARAGQRLVDELGDDDAFHIEPTRDHFDYVYLTRDLDEMPGRDYSAKRNQINQFMRNYRFEYKAITPDMVGEVLELAEVWCQQRLCEDDLSLQHELCGIEDVLNNYERLEVDGGAILIRDKVQAFALGELLNERTAVVHVEKANPEFKGIYTLMNSIYAERWREDVEYINLEQDVGEPGLRRAKKAYHPDHMVEKFEITLA
ncbi:MAG: DUF2156 domain-containing protein [Anaerolineae bacterium]